MDQGLGGTTMNAYGINPADITDRVMERLIDAILEGTECPYIAVRGRCLERRRETGEQPERRDECARCWIEYVKNGGLCDDKFAGTDNRVAG